MSRRRALALLIGAGALTQSAAAADLAYDLTKKAWVDGKTVQVYVQMPKARGGHGPNEPSKNKPKVDVFLVAPVSDAEPYGPEMAMPLDKISGKPVRDAEGKPMPDVIVPAHDDTFERFTKKPTDTYGYWIVPGPKATPETVAIQPMPANSMVGEALVQRIKIDGVWLPLNDAKTVRKGLALGLVAKKFATWGGIAWLKNPPKQ